MSATTARNLAGPALYNSYSVADFAADGNPMAKAFAEEFQARVSRQADHASAGPMTRLPARRSDQEVPAAPPRPRSATGSLAIKTFAGVEGTYTYDTTGHGLRAYHIVRNVNGNLAYDRTIAFDK